MFKRKCLAWALCLAVLFTAAGGALASGDKTPDDIYMPRSSFYYEEEEPVTLEVDLSIYGYAYLFIETPRGRFLDYDGERHSDPVVYSSSGDDRRVESHINPESFSRDDTGTYTLHVIQYDHGFMAADRLGIESSEDLKEVSFTRDFKVAGRYSTEFSELEKFTDRVRTRGWAGLSLMLRDDEDNLLEKVPAYNQNGRNRLYLRSSGDEAETRLHALALGEEGEIVDVTAELAGEELKEGVNIFNLDWKDDEGSQKDNIITNEDGRIFIDLSSREEGEVDVTAAMDPDFEELLKNGTRSITYGFHWEEEEIKDEDEDVDKGEEVEDLYLELERETSSAGESFTLTANVAEDILPEDGAEVKFQEREKGEEWQAIGFETTDDGRASLEQEQEKTGTFLYRFEVVDETSMVREKKVVASVPQAIEAEEEEITTSLDQEQNIYFRVEDEYGNTVTSRAFDYLEKEPDELIDAAVKREGEESDAGRYFQADREGLFLKYNFEEEGVYEFTVTVEETDESALTEVEVYEFGEVEEIKLDLEKDFLLARTSPRDEVTDRLNKGENLAEAALLEVKLVDQRGITQRAPLKDVLYSVDKIDLARIYRSDENAWVVAEEASSGELEVTALHPESDREVSSSAIVAGEPFDLEVDVEIEELEAEVTLTYVDREGTPAAVFDEKPKGYSVVAPEKVESYMVEDFSRGSYETSFMLEAQESGTYTVRIITDEGISESIEVEFEKTLGAEEVVMYIGSREYEIDGQREEMDAAPFIREGHTYVPVRFIAEALGADVDYDPRGSRVETVILMREDMGVNLYIGETKLEVVSNGEITTIEADAPADIENGRTMLPFRSVAEAFGADVDYETGEDTRRVEKVWFTQ